MLRSLGKAGRRAAELFCSAVGFSLASVKASLGIHRAASLTNAGTPRVKLFWELFAKPSLVSLLINQNLIHLSYIISLF